jgi:hypothetical protein
LAPLALPPVLLEPPDDPELPEAPEFPAKPEPPEFPAEPEPPEEEVLALASTTTVPCMNGWMEQ